MLLLPVLGAWSAREVGLAMELSGHGGLEWPMGLGWPVGGGRWQIELRWPVQLSGHGVGVVMGVEWSWGVGVANRVEVAHEVEWPWG